ncbi:MAG: type II toxin-antitoxin system VapC family toxin [Vicinamibacteria bacterium]
MKAGPGFLLDTDVCVYLLNGRAPGVAARLREMKLGDVGTTAITAAELRFGALNSGRPRANAERVETFLAPLVRLPFEDEAAFEFARIKKELRVAGSPIGVMDMLIAAIARSADTVLVSHNVRDFARVTGLRLADWPIG